MTAALEMSPGQARALTDDIRADLTSAVAGMRTAIALGVPAALGYPTGPVAMSGRPGRGRQTAASGRTTWTGRHD